MISKPPVKPHKTIKWIIVVLTLFASIYILTQIASVFSGHKQWDFRTYYYAGQAYERGWNPYELESLRRLSGAEDIKPPFVYPPHCVTLCSLLAKPEYNTAYFLFLAAKLLACAGLIWIWTRVVPCKRADLWALVVTALLGYRQTMLQDIRAGNVSVFEQLLLWGGVLLLLNNRTVFGSISVLLSSIFKLLTLALGPLIVVIHRSWRAVLTCLVLTAAFIAGYLALYSRQPELWARFIASAGKLDERGYICPGSLSFLRDVADIGTCGATTVYTAYALWCCVIVCVWVWAFIRTRRSRDVYPMLYLTIFVYVLVTPRLKDHALIIALLPTLHTISAVFRRPGWVALACTVLWVPFLDYQPLMLAFWMFIVLAWWIWKNGESCDRKLEITLNPLRCLGETNP
jgi:hypothetical protein